MALSRGGWFDFPEHDAVERVKDALQELGIPTSPPEPVGPPGPIELPSGWASGTPGERLRALRQAHRLNVAMMADIFDVSRQTIISLEKGRYNPSLVLALRIANHFGIVDLREIFRPHPTPAGMMGTPERHTNQERS